MTPASASHSLTPLNPTRQLHGPRRPSCHLASQKSKTQSHWYLDSKNITRKTRGTFLRHHSCESSQHRSEKHLPLSLNVSFLQSFFFFFNSAFNSEGQDFVPLSLKRGCCVRHTCPAPTGVSYRCRHTLHKAPPDSPAPSGVQWRAVQGEERLLGFNTEAPKCHLESTLSTSRPTLTRLLMLSLLRRSGLLPSSRRL